MPTPARNETPVCEQCGAPLQSLAAEEGCLNCLLGTGIEGDREEGRPSPNESGARVYQHYEILTLPDGSLWELGRGAMGITYKARDVNLDTIVALKVMNARFSVRPESPAAFLARGPDGSATASSKCRQRFSFWHDRRDLAGGGSDQRRGKPSLRLLLRDGVRRR